MLFLDFRLLSFRALSGVLFLEDRPTSLQKKYFGVKYQKLQELLDSRIGYPSAKEVKEAVQVCRHAKDVCVIKLLRNWICEASLCSSLVLTLMRCYYHFLFIGVQGCFVVAAWCESWPCGHGESYREDSEEYIAITLVVRGKAPSTLHSLQ